MSCVLVCRTLRPMISFRRSFRRRPPGAVARQRGDRGVLHAGAGQVGDGDVASAARRPGLLAGDDLRRVRRTPRRPRQRRPRWRDAVRRAGASASGCRRRRDRPCARIAGVDLVLVLGIRAHGGDVLAGDDRSGLRISGSVGGVVVTMMSAPAAAACGVALGAHRDAELLAQTRRAGRSALAASRAQIARLSIGRTSISASSCSRACTPAPKIAATAASGRARCLAATAPAAAVRTSVR